MPFVCKRRREILKYECLKMKGIILMYKRGRERERGEM